MSEADKKASGEKDSESGGGGSKDDAAADPIDTPPAVTTWTCPLCSHANNLADAKCDMCLSDKFLTDEAALLRTPSRT